ncbi:MAG: hypothetical protein WA803_18300 [Steroidobacteraceae bacterium]
MIYFLALLPATALCIAGYFVLFLSNRSEGSFRTFGKYLGFWAFTLAALVVLGAIFAAAHGHRHHCPMMGGPGMYGHMRSNGGEPGGSGGSENGANPPAPPAGAPNPAAPSPH